MKISNNTTTNTTNATTNDNGVRVAVFKNKTKTGGVAYATVQYGPLFLARLLVRESDKGLTVSIPKRKGKDGKEYSIYWLDDEIRENVFEMIKDAYNSKVNGTPMTVTPLPVDDTVTATVRRYENGNTLGFVDIKTAGITVYGATICTKKNDPEDAYVRFPQEPRMKNGEHVLDANGNWVVDSYAGPNSKEARNKIETAVFAAYENASNEYVEE